MSVLGACLKGHEGQHIRTAFSPMQPQWGCTSARKADMASAWLSNGGLLCDYMSNGWFVMADASQHGRWHDGKNEITCTSSRDPAHVFMARVVGGLWGAIHILLTWHISTTLTDCFPPASRLFDHEKQRVISDLSWVYFTKHNVCFGTSFRSSSTSFSLTFCALPLKSSISFQTRVGENYSIRQVQGKHRSTLTLVCFGSWGADTVITHCTVQWFHTTVHAALGLQWIMRQLM